MRSRQPPLHQLPDGWAGRPVRFNAGPRHGGSLRRTWCILVPVSAPCVPLLPRGSVPLLLLLFLPWLPLLSRSSLPTGTLRVPYVLLCVSPAPPPRALIPCHAISPLLTSYPLNSDAPVCTLPSAVPAVAVLSPVCATSGSYPCPSLLSSPFCLVSCRTPILPTLSCYCPLSLCFAFLPRRSPHPGRHGLMARGEVYLRPGLWPCSWSGYMMLGTATTRAGYRPGLPLRSRHE